MAERRAVVAARLRDRREPRGRAGAARRAAAGRGGAPGRSRRRRRAGPRRPLRQRAPRRGAEDLRARDRPPRRGRAAPRRRRRACSPACPQCRREWGGARGAARAGCASARARSAADAPPADADRRAAGRARRRAAALQHARQRARRATAVGFDARALVRRRRRARSRRRSKRPTYPGQRFSVRCADLAGALAALARADGRMLEALAWRGTEGSATLARWRPEQDDARSRRAQVTRAQSVGRHRRLHLPRPPRRRRDAAPPYFVAGARSAQQRLCALPAMRGAAATRRRARRRRRSPASRGPTMPVDDARWMVPPSLQRDAAAARDAAPAVGRAVSRCTPSDGDAAPRRRRRPRTAAQPHRRSTARAVDVGFSIDLTIDPALQALAQKTAACYTGRHDVCRALGMRRAEDDGRSRSASGCSKARWCGWRRSRSIDVASGRIEALAGALSPCARQEFDGPGRDAGCDTRLPYPVQYRARRAAEPGGVPRRDAGLDDQADHGRARSCPTRERRRALARGRARGDAARRARRRATACAAS